MSRAFLSIRARYALDALPSPSLAPTTYSCKVSIFSAESLDLFALVSTRRLHVHAQAAPSAFPHPPDGGRRLTPPSSPDISEPLSQHLDRTFAPLKFPPALAQRILTHISHRDSVIGHNSRFSFLGALMPPPISSFLPASCSQLLPVVGRRTLEAYMLLFLHDLPVAAEHDHSRIAAHVLMTHALGEHVAPHWRLQDVMRWVPPRAGVPGLDGRAAGLHKVAGTTVEALVGGILHQFVRRRFFFPFIIIILSPSSTFDGAGADQCGRGGAWLTGSSIPACFRTYYSRARH
jgi:hypothetical protein